MADDNKIKSKIFYPLLIFANIPGILLIVFFTILLILLLSADQWEPIGGLLYMITPSLILVSITVLVVINKLFYNFRKKNKVKPLIITSIIWLFFVLLFVGRYTIWN